MRPRRLIASAILCLMLAGATLAAADSDRGRGDRKSDRGSRSEERSKKERKQRTVRRGDDRDRRESDRHAVETRRERSHVTRERSMARRLSGDERLVSRTRTPSGWHNRALRGRAQYTAWDGHRAQRWRSEHRSWRERGGYYGYRIPDHRYRVVYGPSHRFRVDHCPLVIVRGYPRFYHGGYWVTFIDPWPEYWADDWFARDDCYIVYADDGYYLTNVRDPGVRIAVSFTLG
jgi:hypothetical protein